MVMEENNGALTWIGCGHTKVVNIRLGNDNSKKWLNKRDNDHWVRLSDHDGSTRLGGCLAALDMYTNGTLEVDGNLKVGDKVYSNDELRRALDNALNSVQKGSEYSLEGQNTSHKSCLTTDHEDLDLGGNHDAARWMKKGYRDNKCVTIKLN